jgi:hypothetical protein
VVGSCEHGYESSGVINCGVFLEKLTNWTVPQGVSLLISLYAGCSTPYSTDEYSRNSNYRGSSSSIQEVLKQTLCQNRQSKIKYNSDI